jgi:IPTL-CTERM motif
MSTHTPSDFSAKPWLLAAPSCRRSVITATLFAAFTLATGSAHADMDIPAGAVASTSGGVFDLACSDLTVGGTLNLDAGQVINVRHVSISAGGVINGNSGTLALSGNWSNSGSFVAGSSTVAFSDAPACATASSITGNTTFANLSLLSSAGKTYTFGAGSTQTVAGLLTILGTPTLPLNVVSSTPGQYASINLTGSQNISHVGVNWVQATGKPLAPALTNTNPTGNAPRWFASGEPIPTMSAALLAVMALVVGALAWVSGRRRHIANTITATARR